MQQRHPSLLDPPIAFAHRGARAHAPENTLEAFALALRLGATGLESDVWITSDGALVLDHDGVVGRRMRRRPIAQAKREELPDHVPTVGELIEASGTDYHLSLDVKDAAAARPLLDLLRDRAPELASRTWLCHPDVAVLTDLVDVAGDVKLVHSTRLNRLTSGPERHAADLAAAGIAGINLHHTDHNGGLVALFHRFGLTAFAWDLQVEYHLRATLRMGIDAVYSDHVDVMVDALRAEVGTL